MKNKKLTVKIMIDIGMTACLLLLMPYSLLGETLHEWIGMAMFVLFIAHHILNRKWLATVAKGKYTLFRGVQTALAMIMFILMIGSMISGILLSDHIFGMVRIEGSYMMARQVHMFCAYWGLIIMSLHLGMHWNMAVILAVYGVYALIKRQVGDYLLMKMHFVFYDYTESVLFFMADYLAVMILIAFVGYYASLLMKKYKTR